VGSEGTLGVATKIILRIVKRPELRSNAASRFFHPRHEAGAAVSDTIAAGMLPAAIEMMDNLAIQAAKPRSTQTIRTAGLCFSSN